MNHRPASAEPAAMVRWILEVLEGGAVTDHPADRGGLTKLGITARLWRAWTGATAGEDEGLRRLTLEDAVRCVLDMIVTPARLDRVADWRVQWVLIDWAIHAGPAAAVRALQEVVGVPTDGRLGPETEAAVNREPPARLLAGLLGRRLLALAALVRRDASQRMFVVGWMARIGRLAVEVGRAGPPTVPVVNEEGHAHEHTSGAHPGSDRS